MSSYNSSVHKAIKASPFSILLGFEARNPFNNFQFNTTPFYGDKIQDELMKRLQFARNLAKKNNMEYKQTYKKYSDSKVLPNKFSEGMLCWLHQPELLKINPKICSPFFGPWVILTLVGKMNAVIQYLANKKTRFVNINRLRHYNLQTNHLNPILHRGGVQRTPPGGISRVTPQWTVRWSSNFMTLFLSTFLMSHLGHFS